MPSTRPLFQTYDIQDVVFRYGKYADKFSMAFGLVKTSGSSTTVSSQDAAASAKALLPVDISDEIAVHRPDATDNRIVVTNADDDTITVGTAVDWQNGTSGRAYHYRKFFSGTTATDGWVQKDPKSQVTVQVIITTLGSTSIEVSIQGRMAGAYSTAVDLITSVSFTATGGAFYVIPEDVEDFRVGFKRTGAGTNSVSAYANFAADRY